MTPHDLPRRSFLRTVGAAGIGGTVLALTGAQRAGATTSAPRTPAGSPAAGAGTFGAPAALTKSTALPYPTLRRPFAMPVCANRTGPGHCSSVPASPGSPCGSGC